MNKLLLTMTAIPALVVAAPAAAQVASNTSGGAGIQNRIAQLQTRFQAGVQQGTITRREARPLRQQLSALVALEAQYRADGLSREERTDLRQRIRTLHQQIRFADGGAYDRNDRYADLESDYAMADDRYDVNARVDMNRDGYDDRDVDRDGRWDDDVAAGRSRADLYAGADVNARVDLNRDGYDDRDVDRDGRWDDDVAAGRSRADAYASTSARIDMNRDGYDDRDVDRDGRWDDDVAAGRSRADLYAGTDVNARVDLNRDGYDDRDVDRDGRWDDDVAAGRSRADVYAGQGGPVESGDWVVDANAGVRGGVQGLFDTVLGTGGLRVGQRVSGNLYAVPYEYRDEFRDRDDVFFRYDGNRIYEIDARTQTIVRVYTRAD